MIKSIYLLGQKGQKKYVCGSCLYDLNLSPFFRAPAQQRRWITRNHIRNIRKAQEEWDERAAAIRSGKTLSILELLEERGYVNQIVGSREELRNLLINRRVGVYCGLDPTAPSLHVGHMVPLMVLGWLYTHGYSVNYLLGAATVKIGDPTDRLKERDAVHSKTRSENMASMHVQLKKLGELMERYTGKRGYHREWAWRRALVNNSNWLGKVSVIEFLRIMGKGARIGPMLGRDTVKNRLKTGDGMSLAEFTYPVIQAYDWWHLYHTQGVQIQIGGADQFGNILAGAELVKHMMKNDQTFSAERLFYPSFNKPDEVNNPFGVSNEPMGFTTPLLTTASGEKFGKSAGNAVWLDQDMTSSFDLYQFFLRLADADVERYLKLLTFIPTPEIQNIMEEHSQDQSKRVAQHRLAREFLELVHGLPAAEQAEAEHRQLFKKDLSLSDVREITAGPVKTDDSWRQPDINPSLNKHAQPLRLEQNLGNRLKLPKSLILGQPLSRILWHAGTVASRSEGQRLIANKGVSIGSSTSGLGPMGDSLSFHTTGGSAEDVTKAIIDNSLLIFRIGKWRVKIIDIISDEEFSDLGLSCPGWNASPESTLTEDKADEERQAAWERQREGNKRQATASPYGVVREARF